MSTTAGTATEKSTAPESVSTAGHAPRPPSAKHVASTPPGASPSDERRPAPATARFRRAARRLPNLLVKGATKSAAILALVLLWETAPRFGLVDRTFLPPFSEVARACGSWP
ncbi:hypothetical protein ACWD1Y_46100 [Streptomyces sp. NPDC002814]